MLEEADCFGKEKSLETLTSSDLKGNQLIEDVRRHHEEIVLKTVPECSTARTFSLPDKDMLALMTML